MSALLRVIKMTLNLEQNINKYQEIVSLVLEENEVDNDQHQEIGEILYILREKILLDLASLSVNGKVEIQGSFVRRTYLIDDDSFDLLLVLSRDDHAKLHNILDSLENRLKKDRVRKNPIQVKKITGKMPYLRIIAEGELIHLFVGYDFTTSENKMSIFDLIPLHSQYILTHMSEQQRKETLLMKKFCKTIGVYRSDLGATGVNGYLCELLILFYGTFIEAIQAICKWVPRTIIDLKKNKEVSEDVDELSVDLLTQYYPLYVPDPLSPKENVAADVSLDIFHSLVGAANMFCFNPSIVFFTGDLCPHPSFDTLLTKIVDSGRTIVILSLNRDFQETEVCWQKAIAMKEAFKGDITKNNYIIDKIKPYVIDEEYGIMMSLHNPLPNMSLRRDGPDISSTESIQFIKHYNNHPDVLIGPYIENHRWMVHFANRGLHVYDYIKHLVTENVKNLKLDNFSKLEIKEKVNILTIDEGLKNHYETYYEFADSFYLFVERKPGWVCYFNNENVNNSNKIDEF